MLAAGNEQGPVVSGPVLAVLLLGGAVIYAFGYAMAIWRRARDDYNRTKSALPIMRKAKWTLWRGAVKTAMWVLIGFTILVVWVVSDIKAGR